jgi:hypothetical protein
MESSERISMNLVWGAGAIAEAIGTTPRKTFHLLEAGHIPAKKVGNRWVADRKALSDFFRTIPQPGE